jgi:hypothetical protein
MDWLGKFIDFHVYFCPFNYWLDGNVIFFLLEKETHPQISQLSIGAASITPILPHTFSEARQ